MIKKYLIYSLLFLWTIGVISYFSIFVNSNYYNLWFGIQFEFYDVSTLLIYVELLSPLVLYLLIKLLNIEKNWNFLSYFPTSLGLANLLSIIGLCTHYRYIDSLDETILYIMLSYLIYFGTIMIIIKIRNYNTLFTKSILLLINITIYCIYLIASLIIIFSQIVPGGV